jgi:rubredoxin
MINDTQADTPSADPNDLNESSEPRPLDSAPDEETLVATTQLKEAQREEAQLEVAPTETGSIDSTAIAAAGVEEQQQEDLDSHRFECRSCGYVYDPGEGVRKLGIVPGTPFLELDAASFRCPVCRSKVGAFKDIGPRNKPSGFEENLNYGLGVNRLTPGQKNVLIFGGFALAIAFFLSLYSLR